MKRSEVGYCVWILHNKQWGRILVDGKLHSQGWWRKKLNEEIHKPIISNDICDWECKSIEPIPIPLEIEFNMPKLDYYLLLKAYVKGLDTL